MEPERNKHTEFASRLYEWHMMNQRDLPWKETGDPYRIWVSEIILQQTRVAQGLPYYLTFVERFPDVYSLANASEDELFSVWKGLGYYSRARNIHRAARIIVDQYNGAFPQSYDSIISLPGIGPYAAAAISSFAFGAPYPVIDGNVKRVVSRVFGIADPVDTTVGHHEISERIDQIFDREDPAAFNQAIMDFGAMQCKPRQPLCEKCPFENLCEAHLRGIVDQLPVKANKLTRKKRNFHYFVITIGDHVVLRKRRGRDVWQGLYEPLLYESQENGSPLDPGRQRELLGQWLLLNNHGSFLGNTSSRQILSHQEIMVQFYRYHFSGSDAEVKTDAELVNPINLSNFAVPKVVDWYLSDFSIT